MSSALLKGFKITPPLTIGPSELTASTAAESDYAAWNSGTTYDVGPTVTYQHRDYKSLRATNLNKNPATDTTEPPYWLDLGPSNKWRMFDATKNTATAGASPLEVQVTPGRRINTVQAFGIQADTMRVQLHTGGVLVFDQTANLLARSSRSWSEYFFGDFFYRENAFFFGLPPYSNGVATVTFTRAAGDCTCESLIVGTAIDVGAGKMGAENDYIDFSQIERNPFGDATLVPGKTVDKINVQLLVDKDSVNKLRLLRRQQAGKPTSFVGISDASDGYADSLAQLGIFRRCPILVEYAKVSLVNLETEGL